jgi:hypothetical protein
LRKGLNYRSEFHKWPIYRACGLCGHFSFAPRALPAGHYYHSIVRKGLGEGGSRESHTGGTRSRFRKAVELGGSEAVDVSWSLSRPNFVQLETSCPTSGCAATYVHSCTIYMAFTKCGNEDSSL